MTITASPAVAAPARPSSRRDPRPAWIWALTLVLVLYLGLDGGGYDLVVRSNAGVVVWWILLLGGLVGLLPAGATSRNGRIALLLFALFAAWSTASSLWSLSSERSLDEASRLAAYLGVLALAVVTFGDRERAIRHVVGAVATAITVIAALAVLARLQPNLIAAAATVGKVHPVTRSRLSWPLNYWNALAALMAFGFPLLLAIATSARAMWVRGLGAAAIPLVAYCAYLTFSRGALLAGVVALAVFILASPERIPRIATALLCAAGGAILIAVSVASPAVENALGGSQQTSQGTLLLVLVIVVCAIVGLAPTAIAIAMPRVPGRLLTVPLRPTRIGVAVVVVVVIIAALALGAPHHLEDAWQAFKTRANVQKNTLGRFTALSGEGRYAFWKTAIDALPGHWFAGYGVGTFQLIWLPRAPFFSYVINAHSLYVETLGEVGIVGLLLLIALLVTVVRTAVHGLAKVDARTRCFAAAVLAALLAFLTSAAYDWIWQVPVEPVCFLLLAAAALAPPGPAGEIGSGDRAATVAGRGRAVARIGARAATLLVAVGCLILMGVPMAMTEALRSSQAEVAAGRTGAALTDARTALNIEPGAASPALQLALVQEIRGQSASAVAYARRATSNEPQNWDAWLVRSRLEAEAGHARLSIAAYDRARALNPRSTLFPPAGS